MRKYQKDYTFDDWVKEYEKHPDWGEMNISQLQKTREGKNFYQNLNRWIKRETEDPYETRTTRQMIFGRILRQDRSEYLFDDWVEEWNGHPEWKEMTTKEMMEDDKTGASAFYQALHKWIKKDTKDDYEQRVIKQMILGRKLLGERSEYAFDEWVEEWNGHPEWKEMSTEEMNRDENGVREMYSSLSRWAEKNTKSSYEQRIVKQMILGRMLQKDRSEYSFDEWVEEWDVHPEWKEMSVGRIQKDKKTGASGFYQAFLKWIKKSTKDPYEQRMVKQMIGMKFKKSEPRNNILEEVLK